MVSDINRHVGQRDAKIQALRSRDDTAEAF